MIRSNKSKRWTLCSNVIILKFVMVMRFTMHALLNHFCNECYTTLNMQSIVMPHATRHDFVKLLLRAWRHQTVIITPVDSSLITISGINGNWHLNGCARNKKNIFGIHFLEWKYLFAGANEFKKDLYRQTDWTKPLRNEQKRRRATALKHDPSRIRNTPEDHPK